ncbi:MAG: MFS transporter [Acidimicrobiia bacterium]
MTSPDAAPADVAPADAGGRALVRRLTFEVYVPWVLAQLGRGMLVPVVPLYLRDAGLSYTRISVILAALGVGAVVGGLPTGALAARMGPEWLFVGATIATAVTAALLGVSTAVLALVAFRLVYGAGAVGLRVSVQMLVNAATPVRLRGRGMSVLGGSVRLAFFVGPLLGGVLADTVGFTVTFVVCGVMTLIGIVPFVAVRRATHAGAARFERPSAATGSLRSALQRHTGLLLLAGTGSALVMAGREGRNVVVPLIGDDLGLSSTAVGALVAIGTGADLLLFPVAGWLMDRFGRLYAIVPAFTLVGVGLLVLGLWYSTAGAIVAGVVMGIGNGMSAGTMLTLGGDLAPRDSGPFLAALGTLHDAGVVVGSLVVGAFADTAGLATSAVVLAGIMFAAVVWMVVAVGDSAHPTRPWIVSRLERP